MNEPQKKDTPLLFGLLIKKYTADGKPYIHFNWSKISLLFVVIIAFMWMSIATLLFAYFKYVKDFDTVKFTNMLLLPIKYSEHKTEMGDRHIERGLEAIKEQNFTDGIRLLRLGLIRSPGNLEGLVTLAQVYEFGLKRKDIAIEMYLDGFEYGGINNEEFCVAALKALLSNKMDNEIIAIAYEYLPEKFEKGDNPNFQTLAFAAATSSFYRGNFDKTEDYINEFLLNESIEGIILSAKVSWDRGNKLSAIKKLESALYKFPNSDELYSQLSFFYREIDNFDSARRYAQLRNIKSPSNPNPVIELIYLYDKYGIEDKVVEYSKQIIKNFSDNESAIYQLANFAASTGKINIAQFCYELALEKDYALENFALTLIEAHIANKDFEGAVDFSEELLQENPKWLKVQWPIFSSLRALAFYGLNRPDLGDIYIEEFLNESKITTGTLVAVAKRFTTNQMYQQAQRILDLAYTRDENNQRVLNNLIKVNLELGMTQDLGDQIRKLLQTRRPDKELLKEAYNRLGSDLFIFTKNRNAILIELGAILREQF
ncbi:MAG: tetratricopeptide repeat protein [Opitutales bacterium]